jgi:hypothetical protein
MATLRLGYRVSATVRGRWNTGRLPKVNLAAGGLVVTFDVVPAADQDFTNLGSLWNEDDRPGKMPLLQYAGEQLAKMRWRVLLGDNPDESIERKLAALRNIATRGERISLYRNGSGTAFSLARRGGWTITSMDWRIKRRRWPDDAISQVEMDLEFTEWSPIEALNRSRSPGTLWGKLPSGGASTPTTPGTVPNRTGTIADALSGVARTPTVRRHTVRAGETLSAIAAKYYGTAALWPRIADANGIRDPRKLQVGQILTIP